LGIFKHLQSIILLPAMVTIVIPAVILCRTREVNPGWSLHPPLNWAVFLTGVILILAGLTLVVKTISLFATIGRGTLAPWAPPERLVARGIYRHVRNPMITGVLCVLCGEALVLGSVPLLLLFSVFLIINLIYIPLLEEPGLEKRFGSQYRLYKEKVPRWIPRLKPWNGPEDGPSPQ
jgi:protein-S-isoprenylcysteine O-methyltransferase Ste14